MDERRQPPKREQAPKVQPEWQARLLEKFSPKDREVLGRMREAFEERGLTGNWCYEGAGEDITPLFFAPDGVQIQMVDPSYEHEGGVDESIGQHVQASLFGQVPGVQHETTQYTAQTRFEGGTMIEWVPLAAEENMELPDSIDVLYSNFITQPPSVAALHALRVDGVVIMEGRSERTRLQWANHPTAIASMEELGFVRIQEDIRIENIKPQGIHPLMPYARENKSGGSFSVYRKTREFTEEDTAAVILNQTLQEMYIKMRWLVYSFGQDQGGPPMVFGDEIQDTLQQLENMIQRFAPKQKEQILVRFSQEMHKTIMDKTVNDVAVWMLAVDGKTKQYDISRNIGQGEMPAFLDALRERVEAAQQAVHTFFAAHGL